MAQARAVVHVIRSEPGAYQLLEQIGLLIAALGRAKSSQGFRPKTHLQITEPASRYRQRFLPSGLPKYIGPIAGLPRWVNGFGYPRFAYQRTRQTLWIVCVVKSKATFHAQAAMVGRAIATIHTHNVVVFDVVGQQAAHATKRANRVHFVIHLLTTHLRFRHQCPGRTRLHALAAGHTRAVPQTIF